MLTITPPIYSSFSVNRILRNGKISGLKEFTPNYIQHYISERLQRKYFMSRLSVKNGRSLREEQVKVKKWFEI